MLKANPSMRLGAHTLFSYFKVDIHIYLSDSSTVKYRINTYGILIALLLTSLMAPPASANGPWKSEDTCIFGMPYLGQAVKQGNTGLITDILKAVYGPERIVLHHIVIPYKRAIEGLVTGEIHCTLDFKNSHKEVLQSKSTIAFYDLSAAYLRKTGFTDVKDLADKKVGYLHGFDLKSFLPVKILPQLLYDLSSGFHMLERKHASYILGDGWLLKDAMYESKLPSCEFQITKIKSFEVCPVFAPTDAGRRYRDIYDRRMKEMIATGELQKILKAYGLSKKDIERTVKAN